VNSVGIIDPDTNEIVDAIGVGESPGPLAVAFPNLFVGNRNSETITQMSIPRREGVETFGTGGRLSDLAVEPGLVWVADAFRGVVTVYALGTAERTRFSVAEGELALGAGMALARAGTDLWEANVRPPSIGRIDLEGSELVSGVAERIRLRHVPSALAADMEYVWVGNTDGTLTRVDPVSGEARTIDVGESVRAIAIGADAIWVVATTGAAGALVRVERHLGITASIEVGKDPTDAAVGEGAAWVANGRDGTVSRIDTATNEVAETIPIGNRPQGIVVAGGLVWVSVRR
jgi:YVTN family beta-propeller protein